MKIMTSEMQCTNKRGHRPVLCTQNCGTRYYTEVRLCFVDRKTQRLQTMPRGSKNSIVSQCLYTAALGGFGILSPIRV